MAKEWAKAFYHSKEWLKVREHVLKRDRCTCARCHCPGNQVHHIIHLTPENINDPRIALNPKNLEVLCDECHKAEHNSERLSSCKRRFVMREAKELFKPDYQFDEQGNLIPPRGGQNDDRGSEAISSRQVYYDIEDYDIALMVVDENNHQKALLSYVNGKLDYDIVPLLSQGS